MEAVVPRHHVELQHGEAVQAVRRRHHPLGPQDAAAAEVGDPAQEVPQRHLARDT